VPKFVADSSVSPQGLKWAVDPVADVITTAGDLIYGTAADTVARLGIGTASQVLAVNSGATAPEWVTPAAGGGENWTLLNSGGTALTGSQTVTVSGISGKERILVIIDTGSSASASSHLSLRVNADTGSNYSMYGGLVRRDATFGNGSIIGYADTNTTSFIGPLMAASANAAGSVCFLISGCNSAGAKIIEMVGGCDNGGATGQWFTAMKGFYSGSSTISSVSAFSTTGNWDLGTMYVYATA
jgi:hypothetical protein